ncbi:hypothetical protein [Brevundimonas sp. SH203]|uniref:hypothetical protein n=1 Tax=Brevundimonas sp. SH203 TaxID=345167 RepID=UPI000B3633DD|nr:hypothetical protein [Brevundimonas sp. SH203]
MIIADFPFLAVTIVAVFVNIFSGIIATVLCPVWKGDTALDRWWTPAQTARFFTVKRSEVGSRFAWFFVVTARIALVVAVVSFTIDLFVN